MTVDTPLAQRLHSLYAVPVPIELDRRVAAAISAPAGRAGRTRPRVLAAVAVAALLVVGAAGPALEWFGGGDDPLDALWGIATPVEQSVTADGYRVTVRRAYVDRLGVRVAMTVQDLNGRWSSIGVDGAAMTDDRGRVYDAWNWTRDRTPVTGAIATWARFVLPDDVRDDQTRLRMTVTSLRVRVPEPVPADVNAGRMFTSVSGAWSFEFDSPLIAQGRSVFPAVTTTGRARESWPYLTTNDISIRADELAVMPSGVEVRLAVEGLPETSTLYGWLPSSTIEHEGEALSDQPFEPGVTGTNGVVVIEALADDEGAVVESLEGQWRITVDAFYAFDPDAGRGRVLEGPWVLDFDVPRAP